MTKEQQKIVDGYHERVIALIFKRRRAMKYAVNPQLEFDAITTEIMEIVGGAEALRQAAAAKTE